MNRHVIFINDSTTMKSPQIRINQEVYFVHTFDWTWHEKYSVNDIEVRRQLGSFQTEES
jgi:hypothetical protein